MAIFKIITSVIFSLLNNEIMINYMIKNLKRVHGASVTCYISSNTVIILFIFEIFTEKLNRY